MIITHSPCNKRANVQQQQSRKLQYPCTCLCQIQKPRHQDTNMTEKHVYEPPIQNHIPTIRSPAAAIVIAATRPIRVLVGRYHLPPQRTLTRLPFLGSIPLSNTTRSVSPAHTHIPRLHQTPHSQISPPHRHTCYELAHGECTLCEGHVRGHAR